MTSCGSVPCLGYFAAAQLTILQSYLPSVSTLFQGPDLTATKTRTEHNPVTLGNAQRTRVDHLSSLEQEISSF